MIRKSIKNSIAFPTSLRKKKSPSLKTFKQRSIDRKIQFCNDSDLQN